MDVDIIARAEIDINAPKERVWQALIDPEAVKEYMFGATVGTDWKPGSTITWEGEWKGNSYNDKGEILQVVENELLQYSHYSPLSKQPDKPEYYRIVTVHLFDEGKGTHVVFSQNNNKSIPERDNASEHWKKMLQSMKEVVEGNTVSAEPSRH